MIEQNKIKPTKILWVDLEMTGLNEAHDRIVEVAAIVTDWDFTELASFSSGVKHDERLIKELFAANPFMVARPEQAEEEIRLSISSPSSAEVEAELIKLIDAHFDADEPALLAGNSIHTDRRFIRKWWPDLDKRLHYRMLDVSAWKVVMSAKYGQEYTKKEAHRALQDIHESIDELKYYLEWFKERGLS